MSAHTTIRLTLVAAMAGAFCTALAQEPLGVAKYTSANELIYPADTDTWVFVGTSLGADYNDMPFDAENPGTIGVVQMEPVAYRYFLENGRYADGTMFLLTFYATESRSEPQLQGFVQGEIRVREIHVIDKSRFDEGRGFFLFPAAQRAAAKLPNGSDCVECHTTEGAFDATFTQFYPVLRDR